MANEITIVSNLTHSSGTGSTVTSATTTDVVDDNSTTKRHSLITQSVSGGASTPATITAISVGSVTTSSEYWARLRNLDANNSVNVYISTSGGDVQIGRIKPGETWGPCRMQGISSGNPTLKLQPPVNTTCQVEVITCQAEA